jgi:hypothetical protein
MVREAERRDVVEALQGLAARLRTLMDLIADPPLTRATRAEARAQFKAIKGALAAAYRRGATARGRVRMTADEKAFLHPAVHEAGCEIWARWNSDPVKSRWYGQLYAAHFEITYYLGQLVKPGRGPKPMDA